MQSVKQVSKLEVQRNVENNAWTLLYVCLSCLLVHLYNIILLRLSNTSKSIYNKNMKTTSTYKQTTYGLLLKKGINDVFAQLRKPWTRRPFWKQQHMKKAGIYRYATREGITENTPNKIPLSI